MAHKMLSQKLKEGMVLAGEGYLFELERRGWLKAGLFVPEVSLKHPEVVEELHREFARCGSDTILAFTYYSYRYSRNEELCRKALRSARKVADEFGALMAGNICNTWLYDPGNETESLAAIGKLYDEQVRWAKEEGADYVVAETLSYYPEAREALRAAQKHDMESVIMFATLEDRPAQYEQWVHDLLKEGATVSGFNCTRGPRALMKMIAQVTVEDWKRFAALPVAYTCGGAFMEEKGFPTSLEHVLASREDMAVFAREAKERGIRYIGGCCGTAPYHLRAMAEALGRKTSASEYSPNLSEHPVVGGHRRKWG